MKRLALICARAGSKGVPGKNYRTIAGKPLCLWTIEQALVADCFAAVAVTSDAPEVLEIARSAGVHYVIERPIALASDGISKLPALVHALEIVETALGRVEVVVDLDVTSPLRHTSDIIGAIALLEESGATCVITGAPARRSPYVNLVERDENGIVRPVMMTRGAILNQRQESPPCYDMNASVYVWRRDTLANDPGVFYDDTLLYEMPEERSLDIDTLLDFRIVEMLLQDRIGGGS